MNEIGPNIKKLITVVMARFSEVNSLEDSIDFLRNKERMAAAFKKAKDFVEQSIKAVRRAGFPNPYKNSSDEEIAEVILDAIEEKRRKNEKSFRASRKD